MSSDSCSTTAASSSSSSYTLTETPDNITWKPLHYVYVERKGPFAETARACWMDLNANESKITGVTIEKRCSTYRHDTDPQIYRAGVTVSAIPTSLPDGFICAELPECTYARFTLVGNYIHLGEASGRVFQQVAKLKLNVRKDYFCVENYANNPATTKPDNLITEILVPIQSE